MADVHFHAQLGQALGGRRRRAVGTGHAVTEILQYLGDTAHADAANADEMDTAERSHEIVVGAQTTGRHAETSMQ
jgi:hypothetical protein